MSRKMCTHRYISVSEGFCAWYSSDSSVPGGPEYSTDEEERDAFYSFGSGDQSRPNAFAECVTHWKPWEGIEHENLGVQYMQAFFWG